MDKKSKILILGTLIGVALILVVGFTYAYWSTTKIQESTNIIATSCIDLTIVNEENAINLEKTYPISDEEGMGLTPFEITIKNTCDTTIEYQANLEVLGNTTLDSKYLAIKVDDNEIALLNTLDSNVETTIEGAKEGRKLATGVLGPNEWYTHSIRIWMDKDVEYTEETINKRFESKVVIEGNAIEDKSDYRIEGIITEDNEGKTPLGNTDIVLKDNKENEYPTTTDENGNFSTEVPRGGYDVYYGDTLIGSIGTNGTTISETGYIISSIAASVLKATTYNDTTAFRSNTYKQKIKNITIENKIDIPETVTEEEKWDISEAQDGSIMSYVVPNETSGYYDLYIQSNNRILGNENMSYWFAYFNYVESLNGLNLIDTSNVTDMSYMFHWTGFYSKNLTIDLSNFDTSNVTNMSYMFYQTGYKSQNLTIDVSNFDTSNVTNMSYMFNRTGQYSTNLTLDLSSFNTGNVTNMLEMFYYTGQNSTNLTLDLSSFNTSKVTDMSSMFYGTGENSTSLTIDVSNFDTSNVTDMSEMFYHTGSTSQSFTLDVSSFDTSKVTDMSSMFYYTGRNSKNLTIDVSNFDTSNVTDMSSMFNFTGFSNPNFTLNVSNFDTSKVTNMSSMFKMTGYSSTNFTIDVSNFDTSNVTDMSYMFDYTGYSSQRLTLDLSSFNTSKVTNMSGMFCGTGYNSQNFTLDLSNFDTSNVTNMRSMFNDTGYNVTNFTLDLSSFDTSNVTNMEEMFDNTGHNSQNFTLDVSSFDTSNVSNMSYMFYSTGYSDLNFTLDVSNFDTSKVTNMSYMFFGTGYNSTKLNTTITIRNTGTTSYKNIFDSIAIKTGAKLTVNYTASTSDLVDKMIATADGNSNVVKGVQVD
ncbi:MAG: BspA family leucine-rich repeat surface protein [Bacilli bacterium]